MLPPVIDHLVSNRHDLVVFNHQSEDNTDEICSSYLGKGIIDYQIVDRQEVPFRMLYRVCSEYVRREYVGRYDWLSWPDQDEILLGPDISRPYHEQVTELLATGYDWVEFENFVFWFTDQDDLSITNPIERVRHYSRYPKCRTRAWRFALTNVRELGNVNEIPGRRAPEKWPLLHYPARSLEQATRRVTHDRNQPGFQFEDKNWHYESFRADPATLLVPSSRLHVFNGRRLSREITWQFYRKPERLRSTQEK